MTTETNDVEAKDGQPDRKPERNVWALGVVAGFVALAVWSARYHLGFADEGFLIYGVHRVLAGEIPVRDFEAYDPGRYYLAALSQLFGPTIVGVWVTGYLIAVAAVIAALRMFRQAGAGPWIVGLLAPSLLLIWAVPRHKTFDYAVGLMATVVVYHLLVRRDARAHGLLGVALGIAMLIGRNHGLYVGTATAFVVLLVNVGAARRIWLRHLGCVVGGAIAAYSPMLIGFIFARGLLSQFVGTTLRILGRGTNLPLPVPWPWSPAGSWTDPVSWGFVVLPGVLVVAGIVAIRYRDSDAPWVALLGAGVIVGIPYMHHAFSRADLPHLAQAAAPALVAFISLIVASYHVLSRRRQSVFVAGMLLAAAVISVPTLGHWHGVRAILLGPQPIAAELDGETIYLSPSGHTYVQSLVGLRELVGDERVFVAPRDVTAYVILKAESPTWPLYMTLPASGEEQRQMIADLSRADTRWFVYRPGGVDGRSEWAFDSAYPRVWEWLQARCTLAGWGDELPLRLYACQVAAEHASDPVPPSSPRSR